MVLLIIDTQKAIVNDSLYCCERFISSVKELISAARNSGVEVIYVRHDDGEGKPLSKGNDGFEIYEQFNPAEGESIFDKTVNSPFKESDLLQYLEMQNEKTLIIAGLQTDYCIDAAVKCGFEHGFEIIVPAYCNSTFDNEFMTGEQSYRYHNEFIWNRRYAKCISLSEAITLIKASK